MRVNTLSYLILALCGLLSACSMEASLVSLDELTPVLARVAPGKMAIAPSRQTNSLDETGTYRVEGVVGEIITTEKSYSEDGVYQAEINIRYQVM